MKPQAFQGELRIMGLASALLAFFVRYGTAARFAVKQILQAVLPGSPAVVELVSDLLDCVRENVREQFIVDEARFPAATTEDLQRVASLLEVLLNDLGPLVAQMASLEAMPAVAAQVLEVALATDDRCRLAVVKLDNLARRFDRLEAQNRRLLEQQGHALGVLAEMLPLLRRAAGVADFVDELRAIGVGPGAFRALLQQFQAGARALSEGKLDAAREVLLKLVQDQAGLPAAAVALAAAQAAGRNWADAAQSLARAAKLRPADQELSGISDWILRASDSPTIAAPAESDPNPPAFVPSARTIILDVIEGPHLGTRLEYSQHDTLLIGRAPNAKIQFLDDPQVSRHHCLLEFNPPRCYLRDLASSNGTKVNDSKIAECFLRSGDVISVGKSKIRFTLADARGATVSYAPPITSQPTRDRSTGTPRTVPGDRVPSLLTSQPDSLAPKPMLQFVPGYEILRFLGRGGMGEVYLARQLATGREFALKVILPEAATSEAAMRLFLREISVMSRLDHPNIVRFHEMGMANGQFFFAMEFVPIVDAVELREDVDEWPAPKRHALYCGLMCQVLDGLAHAHELGFIHRDIKPANVLVTREKGRLVAKLADFGLAKNFENAGYSGMTRDGQVLGTLAFMAPEQLVDARNAKPAVDLFSVGATLYHYLSNRKPYDFAKRKDPLVVVLEDDPIPLTDAAPAVPYGLAEVVHTAMARDPAARFPDADVMRRALTPFAQM